MHSCPGVTGSSGTTGVPQDVNDAGGAEDNTGLGVNLLDLCGNIGEGVG